MYPGSDVRFIIQLMNSSTLYVERSIGGETTDAQDAGALSHHRDDIDIYSNSWGHIGYGTTVAGLRPMLTRAFKEGSTEVHMLQFAQMSVMMVGCTVQMEE